MTLGQLHAPPDCNLAPGPAIDAPLASKMFSPLDRTSLPNFVSPDRCRHPICGDHRVSRSNVQCNLCLDAKSPEQKGGLDPVRWAEPVSPTYDPFRMLIAGVCASLLAILIVTSPPLRGRAWDYLRPPKRDRSPAALRGELLKKSLTVLTVFPISPSMRSIFGFNSEQSASQKTLDK
jgi:hypothetical protein